MQQIPLSPLPSQRVTVTLADQVCQIVVSQKGAFMYLSLYINDEPIIGGVICENNNRIVRSEYLGFSGDLAFHDRHGDTDPVYTGLGDRYALLYISASELGSG